MNNNKANNTNDRSQYTNNFNRQNQLQNISYKTNWKDGQPIISPAKNTNDKGTPNHFQRNTINVAKEVLWCVACQSPHSPEYCAVAQFIASSQEVEKREDPKHENTDNTTCNMIGSGYDYETDEDCAEGNQDIIHRRLLHESCHQQIFSEDEEEIDTMACNMLSTTKNINLRKPLRRRLIKL